MKKLYFQPQILVIKLNTFHQLMAGSAIGTDLKGFASSGYETLSREEDDLFDDE